VADLSSYNPYVRPPSPLRRFVDSLQGAHSAATGTVPFARAGLHLLRSGGTSLIVGSALGFVDGKWSLDQGKKKNVPVDGCLAALAAVASLVLARDQDGLGVEARTIFTVSSGIFAYRRTRAWQESKHASVAHGESAANDIDPVMAAAGGLEDAAAQ
jgi:NhaP-type Na+/H+ or K+/H+ antiporter